MRTRIVRTLRPRLRSFNRRRMCSESSLSWWARAGLEGVTTRVPEWSSISSQSAAGSSPITVLKAEATVVPISSAPRGWRRSTLGRILPNLSTGLNPALADHRDHCPRHEVGRKRACLVRGDDDLASTCDLPEERRPTFGVQLGQHVVKQEHGAFSRAPGDQGGFRQLQAHHRRALLTLRGIRAGLLSTQQHAHVVAVRAYSCGPPAKILAE